SVSWAKAAWYGFMPCSRPTRTTPWLSHSHKFSRFTPSSRKNCAQAIPDAPAPWMTTLTEPMSLPTSSSALISPAPAMMAVPCWSSWNTGISMISRRRSSMTKHSGALMSSRLIPPNVGSRDFTMRTNSSGSVQSISRSNTSMSAKRLKSTPLPSMTGLAASAPTLPSPSTAVPLEMTAIRLPLAVYWYALWGSAWMARTGSATPGEYARDKSRWVLVGFVILISIFPGRPRRWYSRASSRHMAMFRLPYGRIFLVVRRPEPDSLQQQAGLTDTAGLEQHRGPLALFHGEGSRREGVHVGKAPHQGVLPLRDVQVAPQEPSEGRHAVGDKVGGSPGGGVKAVQEVSHGNRILRHQHHSGNKGKAAAHGLGHAGHLPPVDHQVKGARAKGTRRLAKPGV